MRDALTRHQKGDGGSGYTAAFALLTGRNGTGVGLGKRAGVARSCSEPWDAFEQFDAVTVGYLARRGYRGAVTDLTIHRPGGIVALTTIVKTSA